MDLHERAEPEERRKRGEAITLTVSVPGMAVVGPLGVRGLGRRQHEERRAQSADEARRELELQHRQV